MKDISLKDLLEAGCHFGHKVARWHPKADSFIYESRDGIHIIDLGKTRDGLKNAAGYVKSLAQEGKIILFLATKRQAKSIVSEAAKNANIPYMTARYIGGFLTNWEEVKKNIEKVNRMRKEKDDGSWKKFVKHEQVALEKELRKLETVYTGVTSLTNTPDALFIIDIKNELNCLKEAIRKDIPVVAIVDTNADPGKVEYAIPANDDAVGSIKFITDYLAQAYVEGREIKEKAEGMALGQDQKSKIKDQNDIEGKEIKTEKKLEVKEEVKQEKKPAEEAKVTSDRKQVTVEKNEEKKAAVKPKVKKEKAKGK